MKPESEIIWFRQKRHDKERVSWREKQCWVFRDYLMVLGISSCLLNQGLPLPFPPLLLLLRHVSRWITHCLCHPYLHHIPCAHSYSRALEHKKIGKSKFSVFRNLLAGWEERVKHKTTLWSSTGHRVLCRVEVLKILLEIQTEREFDADESL